MISITETKVEVTKREEVKTELGDFLDTYVREHNEMATTFEWMKPKLDPGRQAVWRSLLRNLKDVCRALDAGFDPYTPPKNWRVALLVNYVAPIPPEVRAALDVAIPIFGPQRVEIYDPNPEHFVKPRVIDPLALGHVDLGERRLHFLVGKWDLPADLKFIEGQKGQAPRRDVAPLIDGIAGLEALRQLEMLQPGVNLPPLPTPPVQHGHRVPWDPTLSTQTYKLIRVGVALPHTAATKWAATMASSMGLDETDGYVKS